MDRSVTTEKIATALRPSAVGRNFLWMTWSGVVSIANSLLVWVFMARMRGVEEVGQFTIVMGLYALFISVVPLGLLPYLVNEISRRSSLSDKAGISVSTFVSSASVFLLISGVISALVMSGSGFIVSNSWQVRVSVMILSLAMIPSGLDAVAESTAIAFGRGRLVAAVSTVENGLRTIVPLVLIWNGYSIPVICISFAAVRYISLAAYAIAGRSSISGFAFNRAEFRRIASDCPTFASTVVFASINWQAPIIMLGYLSADAEVAGFGAASRFLIPVSILMASYANAVHPVLARRILQSPATSGLYLSKVTSYPLIAATLASIVSFFLSGPILIALFGESYGSAAPILNILAVSTIPFCIVMVVARGLVAVNSQRIDLFANILGVVVCFCLGSILIPRYGAVGAAAAQLLSFAAMALAETAYLSRKVGGFKIWRPASQFSA